LFLLRAEFASALGQKSGLVRSVHDMPKPACASTFNKIGALSRRVAAISAAGATSVLFLAGTAHAAGEFTSGDLVVYRVGTGAALTSGVSAAVTLDEFLPGTANQTAPVFSLPMPTASGSGTTPNPLTASSTATSEGGLTLSTDGTTLLVPGYDSPPGTAGIAGTAATSVPREVAEVDASGDVDTTSTLGSTAFSGNNPRSAASVNGSAIWVGGAGATESSQGGVWYTTKGSSTATQLIGGNYRWANIFNNQLYSSSASATAPAVIGVNQIGTGLPTTSGQAAVNLSGVDSGSSGTPYGYYLLSEGGSGIDTAYVADTTIGIEKFSLISGTWTAEGSIALAGVTGLTGTVSAGTVTLYATDPTNLVEVTDPLGTGALSATPVTLATAPTNDAFRGVAFAPTALVSPTTTTSAGPTTTTTVALTTTTTGAPTGPVINNLSYSFTAAQVAAMPGEVSPGNAATTLGLYYPEGVAANNGEVFISNTNDNLIGELSGSPLAPSILAGSYQGYGETGDSGPASSATLYSPGGIAVDSAGDVFIADTEDNVVREVLGPKSSDPGEIIRAAGTGTAGYSGDGSPATAAELDSPQAVAVDSSGDLFIADTYNNVIREVTPNGVITTLAGNGTAGYSGDNGPATSAELNDPSGVAVDALGNVYIADTSNSVIRRVQGPNTSGTGETQGEITTIAGSYADDQTDGGQGGHSGDGGPAIDAQLYAPEGVALDDNGDLYIADTYNNAIREVYPDGEITTLVNTSYTSGAPANGATASTAKLEGPYAVAVDDTTGDVYIADTHANAISVVSGLAPSVGAAVAGPGSVGGPGNEVPEAPLVIGLPIVGAALAGGIFVTRRRRKRVATA
jgi:NHL repeat